MIFQALRRRDWRWLGLALAVGVVFVGLYLRGQTHDAGGGIGSALADPSRAVRLALAYLALPWSRVLGPLAWIVGALVGAVAGALVLWRGGRQASPEARLACSLILFTLATAAMTGLGRSALEDPANAPLRYGLFVAPLHVGVLMLVSAYVRGRAARGLVAAVLLLALAQNLAMATRAVPAADRLRGLLVDYRAGQRTAAMHEVVYPDLSRADALFARLAADGLYQRELHLKEAPAAR
jgi:hypothetical protein